MASEKDKFISNCISECRKKGTPQDQAVAICYSKWRKKEKSIIVKNLISNLFKWDKIRKAKEVGGFESPEPGDLPKEKADLLANVYAKYRKQGMSKEEAAKRAWGAVNKTKKALSSDNGGDALIPENLAGMKKKDKKCQKK